MVTAIGYLGLSRHRLNLTIRANVLVKRILFDTTGERPRATGVEAVSDEEAFSVEAEEIILSAGAIGSPQILMLSGVGPEDHLKEHGIASVIDSPGVGQNLADHPLLQMLWATKPGFELKRFVPNGQLMVRYTAEGSPLEKRHDRLPVRRRGQEAQHGRQARRSGGNWRRPWTEPSVVQGRGQAQLR